MGMYGPTHPVDRRAPALRLVGTPPTAPDGRMRRVIQRENQRSAGLSSHDARRIIAARTAELLEGGRAAILPPERRATLVDLAGRLGLRPFDASLIIAIVQDGARRGVSVEDTDTTDRLRLVRAAQRRRDVLWSVLLAGALALGMTVAVITWLTGSLPGSLAGSL